MCCIAKMNLNLARVEALNKNNYDTWRMQAEALLVKNDYWQYVSGEKVKPEIIVRYPEPSQRVYLDIVIHFDR